MELKGSKGSFTLYHQRLDYRLSAAHLKNWKPGF